MTFKHLQVNLIGFYLATVFDGSAQTVVANRGKAAGKAIVEHIYVLKHIFD
jgi:hypothetical protein